MPEKPEYVLKQHRITATGRIKKCGSKVPVRQQHRYCAGQYRHRSNEQERGDQPGPDEQRHLHQMHAWRTHVHNRHNDIDRTEHRRNSHHVNRQDGHIHTDAALNRERCVKCPA